MNDINYEILPKDTGNPIFEQRENGRAHTPYEIETNFYNCIKEGNLEKLKATMETYLSHGLVMGRLSNNNLRQIQYFAVSSITLGIRCAIQGGVNQSVAYNLSDKYIQQIDQLADTNSIFVFLEEKAFELTKYVAKVRDRTIYPQAIKICLRYIDKNLHNKILLQDLANECKLSKDYLSQLFKKCLGENISAFILRQKLEASKLLLNGKFNYSEVGYYFSFCSETYYISCFKKEFGLTPRQYANSLSNIC